MTLEQKSNPDFPADQQPVSELRVASATLLSPRRGVVAQMVFNVVVAMIIGFNVACTCFMLSKIHDNSSAIKDLQTINSQCEFLDGYTVEHRRLEK